MVSTARALVLAALVASGCGGGGSNHLVETPGSGAGLTVQQIDRSMLDEYTPKSAASLQAADPVSLAYLAKAYLLLGDTTKAGALLDHLESRGDAAFGVGEPHISFLGPQPNPADTVYTVDLTQVADAFRVAGRSEGLSRAMTLLNEMPLTSGGACVAYSKLDAANGCVHNVNAIALSLMTLVGQKPEHLIAFEESTMLEPGMWYYWEDAPPDRKRLSDSGHLAWSGYYYLKSPDPRARRLGELAVAYLNTHYDPETDFWRYRFGVTAALVRGGYPRGCELAETLPQWAKDNAANDSGGKSFRWAAYVHVYAQIECPGIRAAGGRS